MFGPQDTRLAEINRQVINMFNSNVKFGYRLQMDNQTGSLTITNIRTEHTGLYKLAIFTSSETLYKKFSVIVYDMSCIEAEGTNTASVKNRDPSIHMADHQHLKIDRHFSSCLTSDSKCVLKCSAFKVKEANLTWFKGNQICSQVSVIDRNPNPSLHLEVEYQDKSNYSCVLNSTISNQTLDASIAQLCQTCTDITKTAVPVKKGDSVTLHTYLIVIQIDDRIVWMFGREKVVIAEISYNDMHKYDCDETTGQLNIQNGDLTITNTSKRDSGIYELQIISNKTFNCWSFNVTVSDPLPSPQISNHSNHCPSSGSECVVECSVVNGRDLSLFWNKGNHLLFSITVSDDVNYLCLKLDYKDNGNYSCVVSNSLINETKYLIISEVCSDQSHNNTKIVVVLITLVLIAVVAAAIVRYKRKQRRQEGRNPANQPSLMPLINRSS